MIIVFTTRKKMIGATNAGMEESVVAVPRAISNIPR
jgi:hypothetical protein